MILTLYEVILICLLLLPPKSKSDFKPVDRTHVFTQAQGSFYRVFLYTKNYAISRGSDLKAPKIYHLRLSEHFLIAYLPRGTHWYDTKSTRVPGAKDLDFGDEKLKKEYYDMLKIYSNCEHDNGHNYKPGIIQEKRVTVFPLIEPPGGSIFSIDLWEGALLE